MLQGERGRIAAGIFIKPNLDHVSGNEPVINAGLEGVGDVANLADQEQRRESLVLNRQRTAGGVHFFGNALQSSGHFAALAFSCLEFLTRLA